MKVKPSFWILLLLLVIGLFCLPLFRNVNSGSVAPAGGIAASNATTSTATPVSNWVVNSETSRMDGTMQTSVSKDAQDSYSDWMGREHKPTLTIVCEGAGRRSVYVDVGGPASVEYGSDNHKVRLKYDQDKPITVWWSPSKDDHALGVWHSGSALLRQMEKHNSLTFDWDPFQTPTRANVMFNLTGLQDAVEKNCK